MLPPSRRLGSVLRVQNALEAVYALGRLAFGAGLMAAPRELGGVLLGDEAREPGVRIALRTYGTRDVVLGLGTLRAVAGGGDAGPWLAAGVASDVLDATVQLGEWSDLPPDKRLLGVLMALGAAGAGVALLARR
jgi:hypothetical protein